MFSIFKGDPNRLAMIKMSAKQMKESFLHHGKGEESFLEKLTRK
jgi:hypothetical protein